MPLEEYRRKRDFARTPEPSGAAAEAAGSALAFVVQKHAARALHYDLRLEHEGVLLSWAVPKGPSLDPHDKRLAMRVEDHPLDYGGFEGAIPPGEYGAGTVMLWDHGAWEPLGDASAMLEKGDLKFRLHGTKLGGDWALARMRPRAGEKRESWLLIKHRDEYARTAEDSAPPTWDRSVATGRTMDAIASGESAGEGAAAVDPDALPGAVRGPMPAEQPFALCTLAASAPEGAEWLHEVKLDGYRLMVRLEAGAARVIARSGGDWTERFPGVAAATSALPAREALLDGEAVVLLPDGRSSFGALQEALSARRAKTVVFFAFDLLYLDGVDLRGTPLVERKRALETLLAGAPGGSAVRYVDHVSGSGETFRREACALALEGSVSKRADAPYPRGRSRSWVKVKCLERQEFVVVGWTDPAGSRAGFGALLLAVTEPGGRLRYAGRVGSGFAERDLSELSARMHALAADAPTVADPPRLKSAHWVQPALVVEVEFKEWTREGALRQPVYVGIRDDERPADVVREAAAPATPAPRLTNPGRVLWPADGITKRDLADYYETVAEHVLPHVMDRLLTLVRCPAGHGGECFYQKHADSGFPPAVLRVPLTTSEGVKDFVAIDSLSGLLGLVQMGVLEIHTWGSRADDPERPDRVTFDLDPGPGVEWAGVVRAAELVRDTLAALGLTSFVKTTGGKGLHVVAPIVPEQGWDEVRAFARSVAEAIASARPAEYTSRMAKAERPGRVLVDYVRNSREATAVAAYSPRAREGAPVSTPLTWEELAAGVDPRALDLRAVPDRLGTIADEPWAGYEAARTALPDVQGPEPQRR